MSRFLATDFGDETDAYFGGLRDVDVWGDKGVYPCSGCYWFL